MKPRLGDDQEDGWLLLGGQGLRSSNGGGQSALIGSGASLSARQTLAVAAESAYLSGSGQGSGNGGLRGGGGRPAQLQR